MWDNTLAMFFADHGDMMGDFGLFFKTHFWEGSARIPMIMRPPKAWDDVERGVTYDGVVDIMDIFPTMTEAAGATSDSPVDGTSLLPTVKGGDPVGDRVFYGEWRHGSHDRMEVCLIDRNMKYIWHQWGGLEELFDLDRDPTEQTNLFGGISDTEKNRWRQGIIDRVASRPEQEMVRDGVLVANHDPMQDEQVLRVQEPFGRRSF
jgi:arylsulfatase A-like enzyme